VPSRLRPTAATAAAAILVGDPGRALLLAQALLTEPKMSNHARGLWGYYGKTPEGDELTIQATGMGGPSAALVIADLAELGVRRAVRVGTCAGLGQGSALGDLLLVEQAIAAGGSTTALGVQAGERLLPDPKLSERLHRRLGGDVRPATVASVDGHPRETLPAPGIAAADMQTAPLLAAARRLRIEAAALLIVTELAGDGATVEREVLEMREKRAGAAASFSLSG
jgi:uridine phosphorylase